jgi:3-hydroxyisobutyrate dehydrogenase-like beta-hydroxyacid dehydrogenase
MVDTEQGKQPAIGFIGMGHMGSRMATRLLDDGYEVTVYNRNQDKTVPLAQRGAKVADTPRDLAQNVDIVMSCLTNDAAVHDVMFGPDDAIAGAKTGEIFIDLSTVLPETSREISAAVKDKGAVMIDAPVAGSTAQVESGNLIIFVGGEHAVLERCLPVLAVLGKKVFHMGPVGMGASMKLVVNTMLGVGIQMMAEGIALGEKEGIDKDMLLNVLNETGVLGPSHKVKLEYVRREEYPVAFALHLMYKDLGLVLREASRLAVPMPATAATAQMFAVEQAKGVREDMAAIARLMEQLAGTYKGQS